MKTVLILVTLVTASDVFAGEWQRLPSLPDKEGFAGPFAGVSNGALLVGGGANFPHQRPWDGGEKVWYDSVFVLERPDGKWKVAGKLPRLLGYGVSVTYGNGVICVGGNDAKKHFADAFCLEWKDGTLATTALPPLPKPLANCCGALVGDTLYVAGGQEKPNAPDTSKAVYRIVLSAVEPKWEQIEVCPGSGRMLAVAAGFDGAFWLAGGVDLVAGKGDTPERKYLKDAYRYNPGKGWKRIADLPHPIAAAPTPAPADAQGFFIIGGDDGSQVGVTPDTHRGFGKSILRYDRNTETWAEVGELPAARVTVPCVLWSKSWVVPSGEVRPGVRSSEVWSCTPTMKE